MAGAVLLSELRFVLVSRQCRSRSHPGPSPIGIDEADTSSRRMHQDGIPLLHLVGAAQQILGRHALHHHPGRHSKLMEFGSLTSAFSGTFAASA